MSEKHSKIKNSEVCTELDKWMHDTWVSSTRWIVELSNGETVWQDDGRPGLDEESAWIRLKNYCEYYGHKITSMRLQFRNHRPLPVYEGGDAYFFSKLIRASFSNGKKPGAVNTHYYLVGMLKDGKVHIDKWHVPALVIHDTYERFASECVENLIEGEPNG